MIGKLSRFAHLSGAEKDLIFALHTEYLNDPAPQKTTLVLGVYRTDDDQAWPLPSVEAVESHFHSTRNTTRHEYIGIEGDAQFCELARDLAFGFEIGKDASLLTGQERLEKNRIASIQTIAGSGANHLGAVFLQRSLQTQRVWLPDPTWINHHAIWKQAGVELALYPYYNSSNLTFDFDGCINTLSTQAQAGDVVVLHACAHNPTGLDPTKDQWSAIADVCERKNLIPFFDMAYQGFASGDAIEDGWAVTHFLHRPAGKEMLVAQSFSKNFGLYGQRLGALHVVSARDSPEDTPSVKSHLCSIARGEYSNPTRYGSDIVRTILSNEPLRKQWQTDLVTMSGRIKDMRQALYDELIRLETPGTWDHVVSQIGMFSYTGLTAAQTLELRQKWHVYLLPTGRISISGLNRANVAYVAKAFDDVVRRIQ